MRALLPFSLIGASLWFPLAARGDLLFDGGEFQVNTFTPGAQYTSTARSVSGNADGSFVIVWQSYEPDGSGYLEAGIEGQRFDAHGNRRGRQFAVNTEPVDEYHVISAVAGTDEDGFVVVWHGDYGHFRGRRYDRRGVAREPQFEVVQAFTENPTPGVAMCSEGSFVVAWMNYSTLYGLRYDRDGAPVGDEFEIDSVESIPIRLAIDSNADDGFVVVWEDYAQNAQSDITIQGRRYDEAGAAFGPPFQINELAIAFQELGPAVAMDESGGGFVVWQSETSNGSDQFGLSIQARRFDATGNALGPQLQVNDYTSGPQRRPAVATSADGTSLVVWDSRGSNEDDNDGESIQGRRFDAGGDPLGPQFQINTHTTLFQRFPAVSATKLGDFVVVWRSFGQDGDFDGIFGQRLCDDSDGNAICDSLETSLCGDYDNDGVLTIRDALAVIQAVFGINRCAACVCAIMGGATTTTVDALAILRASVGLAVEMKCPACG